MLRRGFCRLFTVFVLLCSSYSQASVVMATRVIYPSDQKSVSLDLNNSDKRPSLVQVWIDNGDPNASPEKITAPFVVTPPVARVDGGKGQTIRITYTGEPLPTDRESIFYVNVLDIPPKPKAEEAPANYLQIAIRSRIKLFFRPVNLTMSSQEAYRKVQWKLERAKGKAQLIVDNPTPYHITYNAVVLEQGKQKIAAKNVDMVKPYSKVTLVLDKVPSSLTGKIVWTVVNDYGGRQTDSTELR